MLLLLACTSPEKPPADPLDDTATGDSPAGDTAETADSRDSTDSDPGDTLSTVSGSTLGKAGLCGFGSPGTPPEGGPYTGVAEASPFGTGSVPQAVLGALEDPDALTPAPNPDAVDTSLDLDSETFDLYIPEDYDGTTPFGLVMYINAGDDGAVHGEWTEVLDDSHLIWVGGRGIGNPVDTTERIGLTVLGTLRALELFNIDRSRLYITGTSGGARVSHVTSFYYPDLYRAAFPLCGAAWPREVEQAYETYEPDSHYEYWGDWWYPDVDGQDFLTWLSTYAPRYALMTSYDDFREGDIQNVYHYGASEDGFAVRLLERPGDHCATDPDRLRDALAWVESPDFTVVADPMADGGLGSSEGIGHGLVDAGSVDAPRATEDGGLVLSAGKGAPGLVLSRDHVAFADAAGGVFGVTWAPGADFTGARATFAIQAWDEDRAVDDLGSGQAIRVSVEGETPSVTVSVQTAKTIETVLTGTLSDWEDGDTLSVEVQAWDGELQVRTDHHFAEATVADTAKLLDDQRTLRMRWADAGYDLTGWEEGGLLTLGLEAIGADAVTMRATDLLARDATGWSCE